MVSVSYLPHGVLDLGVSSFILPHEDLHGSWSLGRYSPGEGRSGLMLLSLGFLGPTCAIATCSACHHDTYSDCSQIQESAIQVLSLDDLLKLPRDAEEASLPPAGISRPHRACDLHRSAFVLYTSGSTGMPKGVLLEHRSLVNMVVQCQNAFGCGPQDVHLQATTITFDVMLLEVVVPLALGGCIAILAPGAQLDPTAVVQSMNEYPLTVTSCVPTVLQAWIKAGLSQAACPTLRLAMLGGEPLSPALVRSTLLALPKVTLINTYAPAEACVFVTQQGFSTCPEQHALPRTGTCPVSPMPALSATIPIGCPISNVHIHILDQQQQPLPVRVAGEICISGVSLARGYLQQVDLTKASFVANPHCSAGLHSRLYKTGDLGRWRHDGTLEILGRIDRQVYSVFCITASECELSVGPACRSHWGLFVKVELALLYTHGVKRA